MIYKKQCCSLCSRSTSSHLRLLQRRTLYTLGSNLRTLHYTEALFHPRLFTRFCFKLPCQFTLLINIRPLGFVSALCGWFSSIYLSIIRLEMSIFIYTCFI
jgi:hypothetical protein